MLSTKFTQAQQTPQCPVCKELKFSIEEYECSVCFKKEISCYKCQGKCQNHCFDTTICTKCMKNEFTFCNRCECERCNSKLKSYLFNIYLKHKTPLERIFDKNPYEINCDCRSHKGKSSEKLWFQNNTMSLQ